MNIDTEANTPNAVESDDVHADVRAAIESLKGPEIEQEPQEKVIARDESGKFAKAESAIPSEPAPKNSDVDPVPETSIQPSSAALEPPKSWSGDAKAEWSKLPPAIQQAALKREAEIDEGGKRWSQEKARYEEAIAPVRESARRNGVDEREGIKRLVAAQDYLDRDPVGALQWLANAYGVDLQNLTQTQPAAQQRDPTVSNLERELFTIKDTLQRREQAEVMQTIDGFAKAPGHEHFEDVKVMMGHLLNSEQASDMEDAYQKAIWATPTVREKLIAAQTVVQPSARSNSSREATERAKRAALSVTGGPSSGVNNSPKKDYDTVEEAARAAWAAHAH